MKTLKQMALLVLMMPLALKAQRIVSKSCQVKITEAVVTVSYPGIQGAPIMRNYTVTLELRKNMQHLPDSIFADGYSERLVLQGTARESGFYPKGTKLTFVATVTDNTSEDGMMGEYSKKSGLTKDGECVIRFYREKKSVKQPVYLRAGSLNKGAEVFMP